MANAARMKVPYSILDDLNHAPAKLNTAERMILFSLVLGLRPYMSLEIGTLWGGSAQIICAALDMIGEGGLVCVDPNPQLSEQTHDRIIHRVNVITGSSPQDVPPGPFDFIFIDGDHSGEAVARDLSRSLEVASVGAYILLHDDHHPAVHNAINASLRAHPRTLTDCGLLSVGQTHEVCAEGNLWGGLRLLHFTRNN